MTELAEAPVSERRRGDCSGFPTGSAASGSREPRDGRVLSSTPPAGCRRARSTSRRSRRSPRRSRTPTEAFESWRTTSLSKRAELFFAIRELFHAQREELARILTAEHGKVLSDAMGEVARGLEVIEFACGIPTLVKGGFSEQASTGIDVYSIRQPLGVVAGITPFNFPAMVPMWMWAPAIACGNCFVLKPSEKDPVGVAPDRRAAQGGRLSRDGVFNVVHGDKEAVDALLEHPGRRCRQLRRLDSDRALHLRDRHEARQARAGARRREEPHDRPPGRRRRDGGRRGGVGGLRLGGRTMHGGLCRRRGGRGRRPARCRDQGAAAERQSRERARAGEPRWGPLVTREHRDKVASYIASGADQGATVVADGRETAPEGDGFFLGVSLLDHVTTEMDAYRDEIFGPVLSVVRAETYDDAVGLVNDNPYGNGVALFTRDGGAARQFQFDVKAGMVGINVPIPVPVAYYSFGGWKASLFGDSHAYGPESIHFYTRGKVVTSRWPDPATSKVDLGFPQTR